MDEQIQSPSFDSLSCPLPFPTDRKIVLGHGSGGKLTHDLVNQVFAARFQTNLVDGLNDSAIFHTPGSQIALTTDCHVVTPIFFPGGDIGRLAVCGTVNDLAMVGAVPKYITAGFILEEGLDLVVLDKIVTSMQIAAEEAGVQIIAGDTKVVPKGKADQIYITTSGFGVVSEGISIRGSLARPGDKVILSGTMGDHGIAVITARGELGFEMDIQSDVAPLTSLVNLMMQKSTEIHVLRDPTRGGVATTLNEIAQQSNVCISIDAEKLPVNPSVQAACDIFGFDPLYIANEGKLIAITSPQSAEDLVKVMNQHPLGINAVIIGEVIESPQKRVLLKTVLGTTQILDMLSGEMLPRIC